MTASTLFPPFATVAWSQDGRALRLLDQRLLPEVEQYIEVRDVGDIVAAIRSLAVRGAPAIGVAAAMGLVVALEYELEQGLERSATSHVAQQGAAKRIGIEGAPDSYDHSHLHRRLRELALTLEAARPTAVNLRWALQRMLALAAETLADELLQALRAEARAVLEEDREMCQAIGESGAGLIPHGGHVLTHCNAGALATAGIGTALAPMYVAHSRGVRFHVFADETRPLLQGARLTAWELQRAGIDVTVMPDGAAASLLRTGSVSAVFVGADRIAANGDVANKVGTYPLALAARAHGVPLYVCAPYSTFDFGTPDGNSIEIEHRHRDELAYAGARVVLPHEVPVHNPAFDVTPADLVTGYITERGVRESAAR